MKPHDDETERYLEEFRPRRIRGLDLTPRSQNVLLRRIAAAAAVVFVAAGLFWFIHRESTLSNGAVNHGLSSPTINNEPRPESIVILTILASTDDDKFDVTLAAESRRSLPSFQGESSMLRVLAKE
jgi:hypothetical protein